MASRRGQVLDGVLLLDKPEGLSSNHALQRAKRALDARKAGHTGTLDPFATGLLVCCLGRATKIAGLMLEADKVYEATMAWGEETDSGDLTGEVIARAPEGFTGIEAEQLEAAREELASTRAQLAECRSQVEGFAARFERIKAELAQIAECLSVRGFLGSFKAKLIEFAENPICKAALAAGRDFMTARDGRRAEKVLVDGAREKVGEMGELSREMDEWSLSDEVGDMRSARRELDVHEAPARPRDNQVL